MISAALIERFDESYHVEKSIQVVAALADGRTTVRIDALRSLAADGKYSTRAYIEDHVTVQPTFPQSGGKYVRAPEDYRCWMSYDLPWTSGDSADAALAQALGFLSERIKK